MTEQRWRKMSMEEQAAYLDEHPIEYESKRFMNGSKKVGDYSAISRRYRAMIGGVVMSGWCESKDEAHDHADELRDQFKQEAADE